ncbi:hypothetical protein EJMOOK_00090 [Rhodanobacter sp. Root179]
MPLSARVEEKSTDAVPRQAPDRTPSSPRKAGGCAAMPGIAGEVRSGKER